MPRSFCLPILAGAALGLATSTAGQQPTFRSMVDAVRVDVRVTGGSGAVRGLSARDFEVRDNGVIQRVDIVSYDQAPLRLLLALDVSASVQGHRLAALVDGCGAIVDQLQPSDLVSLIVFNHGLSRRVSPTFDRGQIRAALRELEGFGATSLRDATHAAVVAAGAGDGRPVAIVFSDGDDTSSWLDEEEVLDSVRKSEVLVYGISAGRLSSSFLRDAARAAGGDLFETSDQKLRETFLTVLDEVKSRYVLGFTPTGVSKAGWHKLDVRVKGRSVRVEARPGYFRSDSTPGG